MRAPPGPPMTLRNMRENGVRSVIAQCEARDRIRPARRPPASMQQLRQQGDQHPPRLAHRATKRLPTTPLGRSARCGRKGEPWRASGRTVVTAMSSSGSPSCWAGVGRTASHLATLPTRFFANGFV
jgi:hypothetical protein